VPFPITLGVVVELVVKEFPKDDEPDPAPPAAVAPTVPRPPLAVCALEAVNPFCWTPAAGEDVEAGLVVVVVRTPFAAAVVEDVDAVEVPDP
jgi:hypothetical protein